MWDRRELLSAFLGAPFAALACARSNSAPIPPGALIGASDAVGHRLRSEPPQTAGQWLQHDVVIIGGGAAGLSAAWRLAHSGVQDLITLELEPELGGTSRSGSTPVCAIPWGAHYVPVPSPENRALTRLLTEMGVMEDGIVAEQFLCRDPQERIFYRGRWYEGLYLRVGASAEDLRQWRAFASEIARWVAFRDSRGRRAFAVPAEYGSDDAEVRALDRMSMAQWMRDHAFDSARLRSYVEYATRDDYGMNLEETSAWAGLFYFASRVVTPGEESQSFITWPEGNGRIIAHLARSGGRTRTGWLAVNVIPTREGADVIAVRGSEVIGIRARHVILAAPQFVAGRLIEPWRREPPSHLREFSYGSWLVANLTLRDRPQSLGFPLCWDNVLYESPSLGYVVATHQKGIDHGPTVFTYYYAMTDADPRAARARLLAAGREEWADVALTDLSRAHPQIRSLTERVDVMRWGHAMVRPRTGFVWGAGRREASQPVGAIHFAHSDCSGLALFEEALYHGVRAAEEIIRAREGSLESFL